MNEQAGKEFVHALETRFTCKRYDPKEHIPDDVFTLILQAGRLSPSSFGFEPWKFLVIEDKELLERVLACSWGAKKNADRMVIILARRGVDAQSAWARDIASDVQGRSPEDVEQLMQMFENFQKNDLQVLENDRTLFDWAGKQTYIALANMLSAAALLDVDATPIEGYNTTALNQLLVDEGIIDPKEWGVSVLAQFGIHDPSHRAHPKMRRPLDEVVKVVK